MLFILEGFSEPVCAKLSSRAVESSCGACFKLFDWPRTLAFEVEFSNFWGLKSMNSLLIILVSVNASCVDFLVSSIETTIGDYSLGDLTTSESFTHHPALDS